MSSEVSTADSNMQTNLRATNEGSHPPVSKAYTSIKQRFSTYLTFNHLGICFCFFCFFMSKSRPYLPEIPIQSLEGGAFIPAATD